MSTKKHPQFTLYLSFAFFFPHSQLYPLLCFRAVRPICGLCIEETEFNLTVLEGYVHPAIHPEPSQCINPWTQPGAVSLGCRLFLVLEGLQSSNSPRDSHGQITPRELNNKLTSRGEKGKREALLRVLFCSSDCMV